MPTILISGAGSGLGYAFLKHYSTHPSNVLLAIDQHFSETIYPECQAKITSHILDITDSEAVDAFASSIKTIPIDLFIHSAGIRGLVKSKIEADPDVPVDETETLEVMDKQTMMRTFEVNVVGTFLLIRALLPNLKAAELGSKCIVMGSRMGSIASNKTGSAYAYRASKAALNATVKSFSIDVPEVVFVVMHPGRVATRLVPHIREEGAVEADDVVREMVGVIEGLKERESGRFILRDGEEIPW